MTDFVTITDSIHNLFNVGLEITVNGWLFTLTGLISGPSFLTLSSPVITEVVEIGSDNTLSGLCEVKVYTLAGNDFI